MYMGSRLWRVELQRVQLQPGFPFNLENFENDCAPGKIAEFCVF